MLIVIGGEGKTAHKVSKSIENTFKEIEIRNVYASYGIGVKVRGSYNPFKHSPVADVVCRCGKRYSKELFYQKSHFFINSQSLECPNSCGAELDIYYQRAED